ncbi:hypothetical protein MKY66_16060 [Paenibacillus sp. FSL R5-0766]|nr:hypothetical protein [Paenibacillus sp. FSL R5-0765]
MKEKAKDIITPLVITNADVIEHVENPISSGNVTASEQIVLLVTA